MAGKQAKILSGHSLDQLLGYAAATRNPVRNKVIVLLSATPIFIEIFRGWRSRRRQPENNEVR